MKGPLVLGFNGGTAPTRPSTSGASERRVQGPFEFYHDAAAVLVGHGSVLAGLEQERLNRVKHTNRIAGDAMRAVLRTAGVSVSDLDGIAYYFSESFMDALVVDYMLRHPGVHTRWNGRTYFAEVLSDELGVTVDPARLVFVEHHLAHAMSAYAAGPFADALVVTLDGWGDEIAGSVWEGRNGRLTRLLDIPAEDSLGLFYLEATRYLAYDQFDEYKVMGLAAYGDPRRYRPLFDSVITLEPNGRFKVHAKAGRRALRRLPPPRRSGEPLTQMHQDFAAAAQEAVERAFTHLLTYYQRETSLRHLCVAGGVMHNSTMVGKIARAGLFEGLFVQPAANDSGCALGAALAVHRDLAPEAPIAPIADVYWGPALGDVWEQLEPWTDLVVARPSDDIAGDVASMIAGGAVVGWVQGRSEFGPRALGNRSILADPRPEANKDRINDLVKHREAYRPFAPSVLAEYADEWFEIPRGARAEFMSLTVPVRTEVRAMLGAVTHVDGTARVQTVSRSTNARFWSLIEAFRQRTGVPVLLNTSFNHSVEPIVQSIDDAMTCFLTTGLDGLVVDDYLVTKRGDGPQRLSLLVPTIPEYVRIVQARQPDGAGGFESVYRCEHIVNTAATVAVSRAACAVLQQCDGRRRLIDLLNAPTSPADRAVIDELEHLWALRLIRFLPVASVERTTVDRSTSIEAVTHPA
jgi:carbamoyltransferase